MSALSLFMSNVDANHPHYSFAPDHLAFVAYLFDRCSDLHLLAPSLFLAVDNSSPGQVVRRELYLYLISGKDLDIVHAHFS